MMKSPKGMSFVELVKLRDKVNLQIAKKLTTMRAELEDKLAHLDEVGGTVATPRKRVRPRKDIKVEPKFRGPKGETWAGRGLRPQWLKELIRQGRKLEEFRIEKVVGKKKRR